MASNTIVLKGDLGRRHEEGVALGTIKPGMLIEMVAAGTYQAHSTAGSTIGNRKRTLVAKEDSLQGRTIDDNYTAGEVVFIHHCSPTDKLQLIVAAGAAAIVKGDRLTSAGDGTVKKATATEIPYFEADEALDNSGGGAAVRISAWAL